MTEPHQREETIFESALQRGGEDRAAYLDEVCGNDATLRERLEVLLRVHNRSGDFMKEPAAPATPETVRLPIPLQEGPGSVIGRYKLLEKIGEGGMGVVYMAEQQEPVRRRVALKVIKLGLDTKSVIARFEAERQALALMDHPNIAKVLDAGATETGRPYFVMELVRGVPVTRFCEENQLGTTARLELFIQVCGAIQHAHQKGIIHRDIKPSNVLVTLNDGVPHPMVIDFGVAKAINQRLTEKTLFTHFALMIGTPAYMSPEQAEMSKLDVDTRSDVYSLGVLLYELLTDTTPFPEERLRRAGYAEMQRIICEEEPLPPSTRLTRAASPKPHWPLAVRPSPLATDLDWIVMKCLEKDRTRRYETANGLAADLKRHLDNEPVVARPPSRIYRLQKSWRRNQLAYMAAMAVTLVLLLGIVVSTWQAVRATRAKALALAEMQRADRKAATANRIATCMQELVGAASPEMARGPGYQVLELLDDFAGTVDTELADEPEVAATMHATIGKAYWGLQEGDKAKEHLARALELRASVFGTQHEMYADSLVDYGASPHAGASPAELEECERYLRKGLAIYRARGIRGQRVIHALWALQMIFDRPGKRSEIEALVNEAKAEASLAPATNYWELTAMNHGLIQARVAEGNYVEAERIAREALDSDIRLFGSNFVQTAWAWHELANVLRSQSKFPEAMTAAKQCLAILGERIPPDHVDNGYPLKLVLDTLNAARNSRALTNLSSSVDQLAELESLFRVRLAFKPRLPGKDFDPVNVAVRAVAQFPAFYFELADELSLAGSTNEAAACRRKAATALAELPPEQVGDPNQRAQAYLRGVWLLLEADQVNDAKVLRGKLLSLEQLDPSSLNQIAWLLATRLEDGIRDSSSAIRFAQRAVAATSRTNANILDTLAAAYAEAGDFTNAVIVQQETVSLVTNASKKIEYTARLRLYESGMPYRNPESLGWRALKLLEAGQFAEAERLAREYLALSEKELPNGWQKFDAHGLLGGSLSGQKKYGEAEPLLRSSYEGMWQREDEIPRPIRPRLKEAIVRLTQLCEATARPDEAGQWRQKLVELAQHEAQRKP